MVQIFLGKTGVKRFGGFAFKIYNILYHLMLMTKLYIEILYPMPSRRFSSSVDQIDYKTKLDLIYQSIKPFDEGQGKTETNVGLKIMYLISTPCQDADFPLPHIEGIE